MMRLWNTFFGKKQNQSSSPTVRNDAQDIENILRHPLFPDQSCRKYDSVFVSHSSIDKYNISLIARVLNSAGIKAWIDQDAILGGDKFSVLIYDAIQKTDCMILLWSNAASHSDWVRKELNAALDATKHIIPCRIDNTNLPEEISNLHVVDLRSDILNGLENLLRALGHEGPDIAVLRDYHREVFSRALLFKFGQGDVSDIRIPGLMFHIWEHEMLAWKGYSLSTKAGVIAPSRAYVQKTYGDEPEALFRAFLKEEGWSCKPLGSNNRGEMKYRTTTVCSKDKKKFSYAFLAEQLGTTMHGNDDWSCRICLLDLNHSQFFASVIEWTRKRLPSDLLVSDDFIVTIPEHPRILTHEGIELIITASFYCDLRYGDGFNPWFDHLLEMFLSYLESTGHTCSSIGTVPPRFIVTSRETFSRATQEVYLFMVRANDNHEFYFLYESETNARKSMGYAKISVSGTLGRD